MNRTILSTAAILGAAMAGMGQSAEVVPRPTLGDWMARNNRHMFPKRKKAKPVRRARLQRATGPGSYDEWKKAEAARRALMRENYSVSVAAGVTGHD